MVSIDVDQLTGGLIIWFHKQGRPFEPELGKASVGKWEHKAVLPLEVWLFLSMDINVTVNGEKQRIAEGTSILSLLTMMNINLQRVAVEYNMDIVDKNKFDLICLRENDRLEIITFVGGGNG